MTVSRRTFVAGLGAGAVAACGSARKQPAPGVPRSGFDEDSTAEQVTDGIDLRGRVAVVTGCSSGIGYETARVLALRGASVFGTSRAIGRADAALRTIAGETTAIELELSDPESVIACAEQIGNTGKPVDMLILNAGFRAGGNEHRTINGVERHFAINHLGHFLLANRLLGRMGLERPARVVVVASRTAYTQVPADGIRFNDLTLEADYSDSLAYGHSKLANVLFALALARRLAGTRVTANSLHPGVIDTEIDRNLNRVPQFLFGVLTAVSGKSPEQGAATSCYVATSPLLAATNGAYFEDCNAITVAGSLLDDQSMAERLWLVSEQLMADYAVPFDIPQANAALAVERYRSAVGH